MTKDCKLFIYSYDFRMEHTEAERERYCITLMTMDYFGFLCLSHYPHTKKEWKLNEAL